MFFERNKDTEHFRLRWYRIQLNDTIKISGPLGTDFPTALEAIAYGKNLVLKHLTEKGLAEAVEKVEWWIKGDDTYYCPGCLFPLAHEVKHTGSSGSHKVLHLRCEQCQTVVNIPADAFALEPH